MLSQPANQNQDYFWVDILMPLACHWHLRDFCQLTGHVQGYAAYITVHW